MVRAKFKVESIEARINWQQKEVRTVKLSPVSGKEGENAKFWEATPSGAIELGCANLEAVEKFELGREYYVDFTPAD